MSEKIEPRHVDRAAYVYVRQSTATQVRENLESQRRQYELAERARQMGFSTVVVIDDDLGVSGSGSQKRPGFGRLLAAVCEGVVGAVFSLEASRLARNSRDWHHLIDLCALTDALVIDHDGVYDPRKLNDRLLLGLKGTMSEFELGLLRQRAQEALRQMFHRGEVLSVVPVGYVRRPDNGCEMTPDRQIQDAIRSVLSKFQELGSGRQVLLWYRHEKIPLPTLRFGATGWEVVWRLPVYHTILGILKNPIYAGAFVHGRTRTVIRVVEGRARRSRGQWVPREQWEVLILDHHPGYITWEEYLKNQEQLESNRPMPGQLKGAAKRGPAILVGLLRCARCGRRLHVAYGGPSRLARYCCVGGQINQGAEACISFAARRVEEAVVEKVLETLAPAGVEAALEAWEEGSRLGQEKHRALELSAQKARYEAERARRQYDAVEPENRLVAGELEHRWNEALQTHSELEEQLRLEESQQPSFNEEERLRLLELGHDLHSMWHHAAASNVLKKRILRTVITEIVADVSDDLPRVKLLIHWAGGIHTPLEVVKNRRGQHSRCTDRKVVELVADLSKLCDDRSIAAILNRLGYKTGSGNSWKQARVCSLRSEHKISVFSPQRERSWITLQEASKALQISEGSVRRLLSEGILPGRQVVSCAPWMIERSDLQLAAVCSAVAAIKNGRPRPSHPQDQNELPFNSTR